MTASTGALRGLTLAALSLAAGCALQSSAIQLAVGRATGFDVLSRAEGVLSRQGYTVQERRNSGSLIQLATSWTTRSPFDDEAAQGATECRTRLLIEARRQGSDLYAVVLRAENTALTDAAGGVWKALPPTLSFRGHIQDISNALALEIDAGVRTR